MKNTKIALLTLMLTTSSLIGCSSVEEEVVISNEKHVIKLDYEAHNFILPSENTTKYSEKYKNQFGDSEVELKPVNYIGW